MADRLETGQSLYIKGDNNENAVLCTDDKTYDLIECETSNSLLLSKGLQFNEQLKNEERRHISDVTTVGVFYKYLSPIPSKPKLKKLKQLLNQTAYRGPELEYRINPRHLYTFAELQNTVQASNVELEQALNDLDTIVVDGKVRILEFEYQFRVLSQMMKVLDECSYSYDMVDYEEVTEALEYTVPRDVLDKLFFIYTEKIKHVKDFQTHRFTEKLAKFFAKVLLVNAGKFHFSEFLEAWQQSLPPEMPTDESMLYGIAIVDRKNNVIQYFPEENLPENVVERFHALFEAKSAWTAEEIVPYIQ